MNKFPQWLRQDIPDMGIIRNRLNMFNSLNIHTVCESAHCPNIYDCFKRNTATFMILGETCTRDCKFCAVKNGSPQELDLNEPHNVARAAKNLGLEYVIVTSVTRDDLFDGGAAQFQETIKEIRAEIPDSKIEVLIPDFKGRLESLKKVIDAKPDVIAHNMETIKRLYKSIRKDANYEISLDVLRSIKKIDPSTPRAKARGLLRIDTESLAVFLQNAKSGAERIDNSIVTKSSVMLGLGETDIEVFELLRDLRRVNCDMVTIGQYLSPSQNHAKVERFVAPSEFEKFKQLAISLGFKSVSSAPLVRSSYHSKEQLELCMM